jgi:hypothetical protein
LNPLRSTSHSVDITFGRRADAERALGCGIENTTHRLPWPRLERDDEDGTPGCPHQCPNPCNLKIATAAKRFIAVQRCATVEPAPAVARISDREGPLMRRPAKTETIRRRKREQRRHDIARTAWSDETMSVVQRLQAGLADLRSRLEAERFAGNRDPR